jgi:hypothetical protein
VNNDEYVLIIITFLCGFIAATDQDMLSGASPSDQVDFVSLMSSTHYPSFQTLHRSRAKSVLDMKFQQPQSQPQPDMLPEFDHQQMSPQVCYVQY